MMIAEEYLTRSRLFRRLRNGPHASCVELYVSRLVKIGLNRRGTWRSLNLVGDLLSWLTRIGSIPTELNERMVEEYLPPRPPRIERSSPGQAQAVRAWEAHPISSDRPAARFPGCSIGRLCRMARDRSPLDGPQISRSDGFVPEPFGIVRMSA